MAGPDGITWVVLAAALFNNIVLVGMLGLCPLVGVSNRVGLAAGIGAATVLVLTFASGLAFLVDQHVLAEEWRFARPLVLIVTIAFVVQLVELSTRIAFPVLHRRLGIYLPLIVTNCAVLGVALLSLRVSATFLEALAYGAAGGAGFLLVIFLLGCVNDRVDADRVPAPFRGAPLTVITAGIMAMAAQGLLGIGT